MEYCLNDARVQGKSGVCMLGAKKQKAWLSDQSFAKRFGFQTVDTTDSGYELLALSFDGTVPRFTEHARKSKTEESGFSIYYSPNALLSFKISSNYSGTARRRRGRPLSIRWIRGKKQRKCPVFLIITRFFTTGSFRP